MAPLFRGRRKLRPLPNPELPLAQSRLATVGTWGMASGALLPLACSREAFTNDDVWTVMDPQDSAGLLDVWGRCWVGAGVTVRHPCHTPAGPGLLSWCQGTRSRRRTAVNKPVRWESKGRAESRPVVEVYVKHTEGRAVTPVSARGLLCVAAPQGPTLPLPGLGLCRLIYTVLSF